MVTVNNRRSQMTKMLFRTSLMELMTEKSINKITIKDICNGADLNHSTFYLHYTDRHNLLQDVENEVIEKILQYIKKMDADVDVIHYIATLFDYLKENKKMAVTLFNNPEAHAFQTMFVEKIKEQIKEFETNDFSPVKEKYVYIYTMQGCFNLIREWINSEFDLSSNDVAELIIQLYTASLSVDSAC